MRCRRRRGRAFSLFVAGERVRRTPENQINARTADDFLAFRLTEIDSLPITLWSPCKTRRAPRKPEPELHTNTLTLTRASDSPSNVSSIYSQIFCTVFSSFPSFVSANSQTKPILRCLKNINNKKCEEYLLNLHSHTANQRNSFTLFLICIQYLFPHNKIQEKKNIRERKAAK